MVDEELNSFFENFLTKESLFLNRKALQPSYLPKEIKHRSEHLKKIANILAPNLKLEKSSNVFIYGKTGTGKTLSIKNVTKNMQDVASKNNISLKIIYVNCKLERVADTEYRLVAQLCKAAGKDVPITGLPTEQIYKIFFSAIDEKKTAVILILDELDQLMRKTGDGILYNLIRINEELKNAHISIVGVSNDIFFIDNLDPRVKSSLSEEEVVFPPYNALQLQDILKNRAEMAFKEGSFEEGVIEKCAALAAREHGDARRALELLRVAGELAERKSSKKIKMSNLDEASNKIEYDKIIDLISHQPKQAQATLYSIISLSKKNEAVLTGEVYSLYKSLCLKVNLNPLTQRRISDILAELDMIGIINAKILSKGRYGRTREISLTIPNQTVGETKKLLEECLGLS